MKTPKTPVEYLNTPRQKGLILVRNLVYQKLRPVLCDGHQIHFCASVLPLPPFHSNLCEYYFSSSSNCLFIIPCIPFLITCIPFLIRCRTFLIPCISFLIPSVGFLVPCKPFLILCTPFLVMCI